jgi:hypothetical protein
MDDIVIFFNKNMGFGLFFLYGVSFSQKMIDGAVKLLPQILHELKSLDETI